MPAFHLTCTDSCSLLFLIVTRFIAGFDEYTRKNYTCPLCCKALTDMSGYYKQIDRILQIDRMPPEYENHFSDIVCYDCSHKSRAKYHFVYHKCEDCGGYNTRVLQSVVVNAEGSEAGGMPQTVERQFRETRRVATSGRHPPILPAERDHPNLQRIPQAPAEDVENATRDDFVMYASVEGDGDSDGGQPNGVLNPGID
jgi:Zinc-ribbon